MKKLLKTTDEIIEQINEDFSKICTDTDDFIESFQDVIEYDDNDCTIVCLRITKEENWSIEGEYHYSIDIVVTDNDNVEEANTYNTKTLSLDELKEQINRACSVDWLGK